MKKEKSHSYQNQVEEIRRRLDGRAYRLGLDMGVGSIGVGIVALEPDKDGDLCPSDLIFAASRIFPSSEGAQDRRAKRGQRNAIRHKAHRMEKLWKILGKRGLMLDFSGKASADPLRLRFPEAEIHKDVYKLRFRGLTEKLSLSELGMALYHIAGHRGASSIRTFMGEVVDEKEEAKLRQTEIISKAEHVNTFIEVLYRSREENGTNFRNKRDYSEHTPLPTRDIIESELNQLLSTQKRYHPDVLDDPYIQEIMECILFENEKLVPEAGNCPYFPQEKKLPKASFLNEERRLWEAVNNVRVSQEKHAFRAGRNMPLSMVEKKKLFDVLRAGKDVSETSFRRMFPDYADCEEIVLQGVAKKGQKIQGFRFRELEESSWFARLSDADKLGYLELYLNCPDDRKLRSILQEHFGFSEDEADEALHMKLIEGYAPVGKSAMEIILDYIKTEGLSYQEAEVKAIESGKLGNQDDRALVFDFLPYYGMVIPASTQALMGKAWHSSFSEKRKGKSFNMPYTDKDEAMYGRIANPVVHQALNELRKIVNEIIDIFGKKPESINVEIARDLKIGKEARIELVNENSRNEKENKRIFDSFCKPNGLGKKYIRTFKLLEEQNYKCPYCLRTINVGDILAHNVDIDHILPDDDTGDSSINNLVVAHKTCNETKKRKRIPYSAFGADKELWSRIEQYVDEVGFPPAKKMRLLLSEEEYDTYLTRHSFSPRFAPDNAYIARLTCRYLQSMYIPEDRVRSVRTVRGSETAILRRAWHLNSISNSLAEIVGAVNASEYIDKKNRTDYRHHALDAIVVALSMQKYSTIIETFVSQGHSMKEVLSRLPIPMFYRTDGKLSLQWQIEQFRKTIEAFIVGRAFVSRKISINRNGAIFKDSRYSIVAEGPDDAILCKRMPICDIAVESIRGTGAKSLEGILKGKFVCPGFTDEEMIGKVHQLQAYNARKYDRIIACLPEAETVLEAANDNLSLQGRKPKAITEKNKLKWACSTVGGFYYQISNSRKNKIFIHSSASCAYDTGENYALDLYFDSNNDLRAEVIRKANAIQKDYTPGYRKAGYGLFERLYPKDVLEIDLVPNAGNGKKALSQSIAAPNAPSGRTYIVIDTFTEVGSSVQVWYTPIVTSCDSASSSFRVSGISKLNARKVVLSSLGLPVYRSALLKERRDVESD